MNSDQFILDQNIANLNENFENKSQNQDVKNILDEPVENDELNDNGWNAIRANFGSTRFLYLKLILIEV